MAGLRRNDKKYLKELLNIEVNGFKFDIANYIYNYAHGYEYPRFRKVINKTDELITYKDIYYFKRYDGSGTYETEIYTGKNNGDKWQIITNAKEKILAESNRFNLKDLLKYCELEE